MLLGLSALFALAKSRRVDRALSKLITRFLARYTDLDTRDYAQLLQLTGGYGVVELAVSPDHWSAGRSLEDLQLRREGVAVLGIQKPSGSFAGVPNGATTVEPGDILVLYGHTEILGELGRREAGAEGDETHRVQVQRHEQTRGRPAT